MKPTPRTRTAQGDYQTLLKRGWTAERIAQSSGFHVTTITHIPRKKRIGDELADALAELVKRGDTHTNSKPVDIPDWFETFLYSASSTALSRVVECSPKEVFRWRKSGRIKGDTLAAFKKRLRVVNTKTLLSLYTQGDIHVAMRIFSPDALTAYILGDPKLLRREMLECIE